MRVAVLDDSHDAYDRTDGIPRLREHAEVSIFTASFGDAAALRGFDALVANRERTRFNRELLQRLPDVRIIAQTGNHARHIDLVAAAEHHILVARAAVASVGTAELAIGLALAGVLRAKQIAGAALDVFDQEPVAAGHPLTTLSNVVLTPHIGWPTDEGYARFAEAACAVLLAYQTGKQVPRFTA